MQKSNGISETDDHGASPQQVVPAVTHATVTTIVVNGREHPVTTGRIDRRQLARLAFPDVGAAGEHALTVAYSGGPKELESGLLPTGRSIEIQNGQRFSVSLTTKS